MHIMRSSEVPLISLCLMASVNTCNVKGTLVHCDFCGIWSNVVSHSHTTSISTVYVVTFQLWL